MSKEPKPEFVVPSALLRDPYKVRPIFVNEVAGSGLLNGVINVTFSEALFTPTDDGTAVQEDRIVAARLKMDLYCAQALRTALDMFLSQATKPAEKAN